MIRILKAVIQVKTFLAQQYINQDDEGGGASPNRDQYFLRSDWFIEIHMICMGLRPENTIKVIAIR